MSGPSEDVLLRVLARELRSCDGLERTPSQCRVLALRFRDNGRSKRKGLTLGAFICRLLDDTDLMQEFSRTCRLTDHDRIPSSAELGIA
jgi:hypothetical protein